MNRATSGLVDIVAGIRAELLTQEHRSIPRNPLIAGAFHRTGAIEVWGRGTNRVVEACRAYGIAEPTFAEGSGAVTVTFKAEVVAQDLVPGGHQVGTKSALSPDQVQVLELANVPRALAELMIPSRRTDRTKFRDQVVAPLLEAGLPEMTIPDKPRSSKQQYRTTDDGHAALVAVRRNEVEQGRRSSPYFARSCWKHGMTHSRGSKLQDSGVTFPVTGQISLRRVAWQAYGMQTKPPRCPDCSSTQARPFISERRYGADLHAAVLTASAQSGEYPAWECDDCGQCFGDAKHPQAKLQVRSCIEWTELVRTMLPQPVKSNDAGELLGGEPAVVIARVTSDEIVIMQASWQWLDTHFPTQKGEPFATVPLQTPPTRVAELIAKAWGKRLSRYRWCPRCQCSTEPERMHGAICHFCAERVLGIIH